MNARMEATQTDPDGEVFKPTAYEFVQGKLRKLDGDIDESKQVEHPSYLAVQSMVAGFRERYDDAVFDVLEFGDDASRESEVDEAIALEEALTVVEKKLEANGWTVTAHYEGFESSIEAQPESEESNSVEGEDLQTCPTTIQVPPGGTFGSEELKAFLQTAGLKIQTKNGKGGWKLIIKETPSGLPFSMPYGFNTGWEMPMHQVVSHLRRAGFEVERS